MKNDILINTYDCSKEKYDFIKSFLETEEWSFKEVSRTSGTKQSLTKKLSELNKLLKEKDRRIYDLIREGTGYKADNDQREEIERLNKEVYRLQTKHYTAVKIDTSCEDLTRDNKALILELANSKRLNESLTSSLIEVSKRIEQPKL